VLGISRSEWKSTSATSIRITQVECTSFFGLITSRHELYSYRYSVNENEYWINGECVQPDGKIATANQAVDGPSSKQNEKQIVYFDPANPSVGEIWGMRMYFMLAVLSFILGALGISIVIHNTFRRS